MNDLPPTDGTTDTPPPPPPPPPPGAQPAGAPSLGGLRRSRSDRVLAGIAGGLGRHFGVDPVVVRIGWVLVTLLSAGSGLLLYVLAWLVIAREGEGDTRAMGALRGSPEGNRTLLFIVLAVGSILVLTTPLIWFSGFGFGDGLALPLLLIAAGVAFLVWPDRATPSTSTPAQTMTTDSSATTADVGEELAEARASFQQEQDWNHGYRPLPPPVAAAPPRPPKPAPFLGPLTVAVLLVFAGVSIVAEQAGWWELDAAIYAGSSLAIVGLGLVASAFVGRARGLIALGVLLLPFAWALSAVDVDWNGEAGESFESVPSLAELDDRYDWGFGEFQIDLSSVRLGSENRTVEIDLTAGELTIWIPDTMNAELDLRAQAGEIEILTIDDRVQDGDWDARLTRTITADPTPGLDADTGTLTIDGDVGFGALIVEVCSTTDEPGRPSCP
ncbi:MAG: PspC domain-containing protein [Actinomycetota bacterium]